MPCDGLGTRSWSFSKSLTGLPSIPVASQAAVPTLADLVLTLEIKLQTLELALDYHRDLVSTLGLRGTVPPERRPWSLAQHTLQCVPRRDLKHVKPFPSFLLGA